jgi:hypothetical protein
MSSKTVEEDSEHALPPCNDVGVFLCLALLDCVVAQAVSWRDRRDDKDGI